MSWDTDYRREKCPCGKGYVVQVIRSNDWNQYEEGTPYIECEECKRKYKVVSIHYFELPWKGNGIAYYLVPMDLADDAQYEHEYTSINPYVFARKDFPKYLICSYSLSGLNDAADELAQISSCSRVDGILHHIVKDRRCYLHSCKKADLMKDLQIAIKNYNDGPNFEKIEAERHRNGEKIRAFNEKIKSQGTKIF